MCESILLQLIEMIYAPYCFYDFSKIPIDLHKSRLSMVWINNVSIDKGRGYHEFNQQFVFEKFFSR